MAHSTSRLFGTAARSRVLLALALLEQSYPREIARVCKAPLVTVQRAVNDLERQGVVASRLRGRLREVRLNPSHYAAREIRALLLRLSDADEDLVCDIESLRRRPRRVGKPL